MNRERVELPYLDGLRGLAALVVVVHHAYLFTGLTGDVDRAMPALAAILALGNLGVPVFIVLSGYVLMLPVASRPDFAIQPWRFLRRRARRILPPYYAALLISVTLIALIPAMQRQSGTQWDSKVPISVGDVVSHALLLHDLNPASFGKINGPLWSVAIEWHIYFAMPFLLLPLWRRVNPYAIVVGLLAVTLVPVLVGMGTYAHPWFLALFAGGMLAAQMSGEGMPGPRRDAILALASAGVLLVLTFVASNSALDATWLLESAVGVVMVVLLARVGAARVRDAGVTPLGLRWLESPPMLFLGLISYSVYLLHSPLLALVNLMCRDVNVPVGIRWALMTFVAAPIVVVACSGFYWLVERNFKNTRQRHASAEIAHSA